MNYIVFGGSLRANSTVNKSNHGDLPSGCYSVYFCDYDNMLVSLHCDNAMPIQICDSILIL